MKEFEFMEGSLEANGIQEDTDLQCTYSADPDFHFGCSYLVFKDDDGLYLIDERGCEVCCAQGLVKFKVSASSRKKPQGQKPQDKDAHSKCTQDKNEQIIDGHKAFDLIKGLL